MGDVFISYSRKDAEFVRQLYGALSSRERDAWVDWEGIPPVAEFLQEIYNAIESQDVFVFIISPDSVTSDVCRLEIEHAVANNKRLVPIVRRDVPADQVHNRLAEIDWIFMREADEFEAACDKLLLALDTDLDWLHTHTRLLVRAHEWERRGQDRSLLLRGRDLRQVMRALDEFEQQKEPQPTKLQRTYVDKSHTAAKNRTVNMSLGVGGMAIVLIILMFFAQLYDAKGRVSAFLESDYEAEQFNDEVKTLLEFPGIFVADRLAAELDQLVHASAGEMSDSDRLVNGWRSAHAAIGLIHAERTEDALQVFNVSGDLEPLTQFVHRCSARGVTAKHLYPHLRERLASRRDGTYNAGNEEMVCYGLILSLGHLLKETSSLDSRTRKTIIDAYENDPSSAIHGACRWFLTDVVVRDQSNIVAQLDEKIAAIQMKRMDDGPEWMDRLRLRSNSDSSKYEWFTLQFPQYLYVTMIVLPPDEFRMGHPAPGADDAFPRRKNRMHFEFPRRVRISRAFAISSEEFPMVGQAPLFEERKPTVTWAKAAQHCNEKTLAFNNLYQSSLTAWYQEDEMTEGQWRIAVGADGFRLPTEAEWEYACRSGTYTHFSFGLDAQVADDYAQFTKGNEQPLDTTYIGRLLPNCRGLVDMHGGRFEWVHDPYLKGQETAEPADAIEDPGLAIVKTSVGDELALRGGSAGSTLINCRSASRNIGAAEKASFRLCLPLK